MSSHKIFSRLFLCSLRIFYQWLQTMHDNGIRTAQTLFTILRVTILLIQEFGFQASIIGSISPFLILFLRLTPYYLEVFLTNHRHIAEVIVESNAIKTDSTYCITGRFEHEHTATILRNIIILVSTLRLIIDLELDEHGSIHLARQNERATFGETFRLNTSAIFITSKMYFRSILHSRNITFDSKKLSKLHLGILCQRRN